MQRRVLQQRGSTVGSFLGRRSCCTCWYLRRSSNHARMSPLGFSDAASRPEKLGRACARHISTTPLHTGYPLSSTPEPGYLNVT